MSDQSNRLAARRQREQANLAEATEKLVKAAEALRDRIGLQQKEQRSAEDMIVAYHRFRIACETFDRLSRDVVDRWIY